MNNKLYIWILGWLILFIACNEDLGNYDYIDVNEVGISLKPSYGVKREYQTYVIRPEILQSQLKNYDNLEFVWTGNAKSEQYKGDIISTADTVAVLINPDAEDYSDNYYLRLYVTDKLVRLVYRLIHLSFPVGVIHHSQKCGVLHSVSSDRLTGKTELSCTLVTMTQAVLT